MVCIFRESVDKHAIKHDPIRAVFEGHEPQVIQVPVSEGPLVFSSPDAGLEVVYIEKRLEIQLSAPPDATATRGFSEVIREVLAASGCQLLKSYGFNFSYEVRSSIPVHELFGFRSQCFRIPELEFCGDSFVRLTFMAGGTRLAVDFRDGDGLIRAHVNAHHEESVSTSDLAVNIIDVYNSDLEASLRLVKEVASTLSRPFSCIGEVARRTADRSGSTTRSIACNVRGTL